MDLELFYRYFETIEAGTLIKMKLVSLSWWRTLLGSEMEHRENLLFSGVLSATEAGLSQSEQDIVSTATN